MSEVNIQNLLYQLQIDEKNAKIQKRKAKMENELSYLKNLQVNISKETLVESFEEVVKLDQRSFGQVFLVRENENGQQSALKRIQMTGKEDEDQKIVREIIASKELIHENVVHYYGYWIEFDGFDGLWVNILMELCNSNLSNWFEEDNDREYNDCMKKVLEISRGLKYIHDQNIIHEDLKPENILIDKNGVCKITDYGLSRLHTAKAEDIALYCHSNTVGNLIYGSPELLEGTIYNFKVDIFSLGYVFIGIFTKFEDKKDMRKVISEIKETRKFPKIYESKLDLEGEIIKRMTENDPNLRPNSEEILSKLNWIYENSPFKIENQTDKKVVKRKKLVENRFFYLASYKIRVDADSYFNQFDERESIGRGCFGEVFKARYKDGEMIAIKRIHMMGRKEEDIRILRELKASQIMKHKNVVHFENYWIEFDEIDGLWANLMMELCNGNLADWMKNDKTRNHHQCMKMFREISNGLKYIHDQNIIHRDLKPKNILIDMNGVCKISDFGLSTFHATRDENVGYYYHTGAVGTWTYAAPEQKSTQNQNRTEGTKYDYKVDIFSLGCILVGIFIKFPTDSELISALTSLKENRELNDNFKNNYQSAGKLILDMTEHDPLDRIDINQVIERRKAFDVTIEANVSENFKVNTETIILMKEYEELDSSDKEIWEHQTKNHIKRKRQGKVNLKR